MPRTRSTRAYHHGDLPDTVLAAALAALDRDGDVPSLRTLAERCGVSHTALYRHFADLDALSLAVGARCNLDLAAAVRRAMPPAGTVDERFLACGRAYIRWGIRHPGRYRFMTGPGLAGHRDHAAFASAAGAAFGVLVEAVAAFGVRDPVVVAHTIFAAAHGLVDLTVKGRTIPGRAASLEVQTKRLLDAMVRYVRASAQAPEPRGGSR